MLKIVAHVGTDPLRRKLFPQLAISIRTPSVIHSIVRRYFPDDLCTSREMCRVQIKEEFLAVAETSKQGHQYRISVRLEEFGAELIFVPQVQGWKPWGGGVPMEKGRRRGEFAWYIPVPKARVTGRFSLGGTEYPVEDGVGYHDHNYWKVMGPKRLFMDDVVSRWYWGRYLDDRYALVFACFQMRRNQIRSLMLARNDKIIHSSNNWARVTVEESTQDRKLQVAYPSRIRVSLTGEGRPMEAVFTARELTDRKDLLEGVPAIVKRILKSTIARPAYHGVLSQTVLTTGGEVLKGLGIFESMSFRG
jgi:hypothetical protein